MPLSSYRMHRIYLAATMNYGLGSDDPEELAYYNKIRKEMDDIKKQPIKKGISLNWDTPEGMDKWIWILFLLIDGSFMLNWSNFIDDS